MCDKISSNVCTKTRQIAVDHMHLNPISKPMAENIVMGNVKDHEKIRQTPYHPNFLWEGYHQTLFTVQRRSPTSVSNLEYTPACLRKHINS